MDRNFGIDCSLKYLLLMDLEQKSMTLTFVTNIFMYMYSFSLVNTLMPYFCRILAFSCTKAYETKCELVWVNPGSSFDGISYYSSP